MTKLAIKRMRISIFGKSLKPLIFLFLLLVFSILPYKELPALGVGVVLAAEDNASLIERRENIENATGSILVDGRMLGSGVLVTPDGLVLTALHVVSAGSRYQLLSKKYGQIPLSIIATDPGHDIALLKAPEVKEGYGFLPLARKRPEVADRLFLLGNPVFRHDLWISGHVARQDDGYEWQATANRYIENTYVAAMTPEGTSGGAWINLQGEIVGLQIGIMVKRAQLMGISYMAPIDALKVILAAKNAVYSPSLACVLEETWELSPLTIKRYPAGITGLVVGRMNASSPFVAARVHTGEVITRINGDRVEFRDDFLRTLRRFGPRSSLVLKVLAIDGKTARNVNITLPR
ncbi:MAG: trypsin-like peptidase domain-containing protein [Geopsychrobacter sp.]|nr:trypsin-like peptidase domain-containing protein [Geopsychrobacter sp.]